jgi:hypothetical protein
MALGRSFAKICRCDAVSVVASAAPGFGGVGEASRKVEVGNRSDAVRSVGSRPIASACLEQCRWQSAASALCTLSRHSQMTRRNRLQRATRSLLASGMFPGRSTCWNASTPSSGFLRVFRPVHGERIEPRAKPSILLGECEAENALVERKFFFISLYKFLFETTSARCSY